MRFAIRLLVPCVVLGLLGGLFLTGAAAPPPAKAKLQYSRDVLPILSAACFNCHGPDEGARKAGLRLDTIAGATAKLKTGDQALVPGDASKSTLVERIRATGREQMPPAKHPKQLSAADKETLARWIEEGAEYQSHWAFAAPKRPAVPKTKNAAWAKNAIDSYILAQLESAGLQPSSEADRYTLARRVAIDLTGLPPSVEAADRFAKDASPQAYEKFVDEVLASKAYGERWAAVWLDLARYADSNGYADDKPRVIWRWRDWTIDALNRNLPFDRFTIEQIAGDLLPNPTNEQIIATGFHRNTLTNDEGGTNDEEFRVAAVVDRVNTTLQVWMGLTMACAQCHTHKYDPLTHEDYYKLFAILNQTEDNDQPDNRPLLTIYSPEQEKETARLKDEIAKQEKVVAEERANAAAKDPALPQRMGPLATRFLRVELIGKGAYLHLAEVQAFVGDENVAVKGKASQVSTDFDGPAALAIDGKTDGDYAQKSVSHTGMADNPWWEVDLGKAVTLDRVAIWNRTDGGTSARLNHWRIIALDEQRKPVWIKTYKQAPTPSVAADLPKTAETLDAATKTELAQYGKTEIKATPGQKQLDELKKQLAAVKPMTTPIMKELPDKQQRKTHILIRGNFLDKGAEVKAGVPGIFPQLPQGQAPNRLALAEWLVSPENPLTARVAVNRYWEQIFGIGLVETPEDFGIRSKPPSHPELLDWLATEFIAQKWDAKQFLKLIVTSATYRQSARVTPELLERDPNNRLYARGPRFRSTAEAIRDQSLHAAGLLSAKMYGPPVRPYRPKLGLAAAFGGNTDWDASPGEDRYRRALYTEWRRTTPYPSMVAFDAPNRNVCTVNRPRTNTPLQALVTLNDPVYVEAAQALARRMVKDGGPDAESRVTYAFRLCVTRPPRDVEVKRLVELYNKAREEYSRDPKKATELATVPLGPLPAGMDAVDLAAWTVVGNVLLNLDEMFTKR